MCVECVLTCSECVLTCLVADSAGIGFYSIVNSFMSYPVYILSEQFDHAQVRSMHVITLQSIVCVACCVSVQVYKESLTYAHAWL